ncbi:MAG: DNA primase [Verrucomicrobiales bacterium]|nr:DNA primase [Verrucomicrobiales bacterium]
MAIISQETIQKILDDNDIVELIQGYFPLKRAGTNWVANCPFHNEKTPSFNVVPGRQIFHCFGCQAGGDAIKFVQMYDNLPFPEAARKLADRAGIMLQEEVYDPKAEARRKGKSELMRLQRAATEWFHLLLFKKPFAQPARDYLKSRGLGMEVSRNWKFGYAPEDQRSFFDWAHGEGFSVQQLVDGGLAKWRDEHNPNRGAYSFFRHRLMFPLNNDFGEPLAFSGRVLSAEQGGGKYVNSPETSLFNKSKTLFGLDRSKRAIIRDKKVIIFEGQLDLIAAFENEIENVVAPLGTALTEDHARILKRHTDEVVLCYDSDNAGVKAASKAFKLLAPTGMLVRLAQLPEGEDPDSLIRSQGADALREIVGKAPEFFDFQIDSRGTKLNQGTLRDRLNFAKDLATDIALIDDRMLLDSLISRVTIRLGVGEDDVRKLVHDAISATERFEKTKRKRDAIAKRREEEGHHRPPQNRGHYQPQENPDLPVKSAAPTEIKSRSVRLLCRALLTDKETKETISSQPIPEYFRNLTETELLTAIWMAPFDPGVPSSVNAFISQLGNADQQCLTRLLTEESANLTLALAHDCLAKLVKQSIQNQISVTKAQLGAPNLPPQEIERLSKLLLDLRIQLHDR